MAHLPPQPAPGQQEQFMTSGPLGTLTWIEPSAQGVLFGVLLGIAGPFALGVHQWPPRRTRVVKAVVAAMMLGGLSGGLALLRAPVAAGLDSQGTVPWFFGFAVPFFYTAGVVQLVVALLLGVPAVAAHLPSHRHLRQLADLDLEAFLLSPSDDDERAAAAQELRRRRLGRAAPHEPGRN
jgi:hypothetical protein